MGRKAENGLSRIEFIRAYAVEYKMPYKYAQYEVEKVFEFFSKKTLYIDR